MPSINIIDHDIAFTFHGSVLRYSLTFFPVYSQVQDCLGLLVLVLH